MKLVLLWSLLFTPVTFLQAGEPPAPKETDTQPHGFYDTAYLSAKMGGGTSSGLSIASGLHNVAGYRWGWLGLGLGAGIENYSRGAETIAPVYLEWRGFMPFGQNGESFYLAFSGGYGFALKRAKDGITEASGGPLWHPAVGYRFDTGQGVAVSLDLGYATQNAKFTRTLWNGDVERKTMTYQRLALRIGITFG
jgi:hypothetical protein